MGDDEEEEELLQGVGGRTSWSLLLQYVERQRHLEILSPEGRGGERDAA
jgi:hypothetical protein